MYWFNYTCEGKNVLIYIMKDHDNPLVIKKAYKPDKICFDVDLMFCTCFCDGIGVGLGDRKYNLT